MDYSHADDLVTSKKLDYLDGYVSKHGTITLRMLVDELLDEGIYLLVIILIAPFLIPVSLPGISTPFGALIIFLAISNLLNRDVYLPKRVAETEVSAENIHRFFGTLRRFLRYVSLITYPRGNLTGNIVIIKFNSLIIIVLAFILFLPLPVPFTDFFPAICILLLSLSNLEHDTYLMLIGYLATILTLLYFYSMWSVALRTIEYILNHYGIEYVEYF